MPEITINTVPMTSELNTKKTVKEAIDQLHNFQHFKKRTVVSITLDGQMINIYDEDPLLVTPIDEFSSVDFTVKTNIELALDALDSSFLYIDAVLESIELLTQLYQENKYTEANSKFTEVIDIMSLFVQLISQIHTIFRDNLTSEYKKDDKVEELELHLLAILKAIVPAQEKKDIIMLCDLLEYELVDNLNQWKTSAIPILKKESTNS
ncbi:MAG: hypothetical protein ISR65_04170 [Bacteriovoracaceae bacterium]|nr:hypothetical protein [Bacteriovoracaceae bacterium]